MPSSPLPTYETILNDLAASIVVPISLDDLIEQMLARKPSSACICFPNFIFAS